MRNLMTEFKLDKRMSPLVFGRGGLGDDWAYTARISALDAVQVGMAVQMANVRIVMEMDGPHQSGRIMSIELASVKSRPRKELMRGISLGEAWDFCQLVPGRDVAEMAAIYFRQHVLTQSQWDEAQAAAVETRRRLDEADRQNARRVARSGTVLVERGVPVYVSPAAAASRLAAAAERELAAAVRRHTRTEGSDIEVLVALAASLGMGHALERLLNDEVNAAKRALKAIKRAR